MKCKRCDRTYTPEGFDLGVCCICFRDLAYERVLGEDWRQIIKANFEKVNAADALAEKAKQLLEHIRMGWAHGEECNALDAALRQYEATR